MCCRCRVIAKVFDSGLVLVIIYDLFFINGFKISPKLFFYFADAYIMGELYRVF